MDEYDGCRVYWGSHGCDLTRGHEGHCVCRSCYDPKDTEGYVGVWPYYGPETQFYGEDAAARGLPLTAHAATA
jgi:hypothetical protein